MTEEKLNEPNAPALNPNNRRDVVGQMAAGLALLAMVGVAYWPSLRGGFVWDDLVLVKNNPLVTGVFSLRTVWWGTDFPLSTVVLWWEWLGFGENPTGYRVVNAFLHGGSVVLFWRVLGKLRVPGAWLGAAIFALHPMAVASVAWISELKNTLSLVFLLLSLRAFLAYQQAAGPLPNNRAHRAYALSFTTFILALLAKTSVVGLPLLLLGLIAWERRISPKDLLRLLPFFAASASFGLMTIWFQTHQAIRNVTVQTEGFWLRLADAGTAIWFYLGKALAPVNLCAIYPDWETSLPGLMRFLPLALLGGTLGAVWHIRKRWGRAPGLALGAFIVLLAPVAGLMDMYFMVFSRVSDHFAYLALLVVAAALGAAISQIRQRQITIGLTIGILVGLMGLTQTRARVYASDEALWRDTVQKNPAAWNAHNNLACNLAERGQLQAAMQHFSKSLELNPRNAQAHLNLAKGLLLTGRFQAAEAHFQKALELKPEDVETLVTYGKALAENRRITEAVQQLRKAADHKPTPKIRLLLANLLAASGKLEAAAVEYRKVIAAEPNSSEALNNLAWIRAGAPDPTLRNGAEAVQLAQTACRLTNYQQPATLGTLAAAFAEAGDFTNAVITAQTAIDLATASGNENFANKNRQLQRRYQSGLALPTAAPR